MPVTRARPGPPGAVAVVTSPMLRSAAVAGILAALLAGCGLDRSGTDDPQGEDMDHADADRLTRDRAR